MLMHGVSSIKIGMITGCCIGPINGVTLSTPGIEAQFFQYRAVFIGYGFHISLIVFMYVVYRIGFHGVSYINCENAIASAKIK